MNREYLLGAISVYLLIVFHVVRALWRLHVANELEPTVEDIINERNIVENDLMKLSQVYLLPPAILDRIPPKATEMFSTVSQLHLYYFLYFLSQNLLLKSI